MRLHVNQTHNPIHIYRDKCVPFIYIESTFIAFNLILEFISVFSFLILVFVFVQCSRYECDCIAILKLLCSKDRLSTYLYAHFGLCGASNGKGCTRILTERINFYKFSLLNTAVVFYILLKTTNVPMPSSHMYLVLEPVFTVLSIHLDSAM